MKKTIELPPLKAAQDGLDGEWLIGAMPGFDFTEAQAKEVLRRCALTHPLPVAGMLTDAEIDDLESGACGDPQCYLNRCYLGNQARLANALMRLSQVCQECGGTMDSPKEMVDGSGLFRGAGPETALCENVFHRTVSPLERMLADALRGLVDAIEDTERTYEIDLVLAKAAPTRGPK